MSNPLPPNLYGTIANSLANPVVLTEEEKLFQEALENAKQTKKHHLGSIPALFSSLQSARTVSDVYRILQDERARNSIWQEQHGRKWMRALDKLAKAIVSCKPLVDQLIQIGSKVAAPVWGGIAFIFGVIKDLTSTEETLKQVQIRLEGSFIRFQEYYRPTQIIQNSLRCALLQYYERIIIFVVDLQAKFAHGWALSLWKAVDRSVKEAVELFNREVKDLIENVDWAACARSRTEAHENQAEILRMIGNIQIQPVPGGGVIQPTGTTRTFSYGVPRMLSSKFTGRDQSLRAIRAILTRDPQSLSQVAIFGWGGVGKTQILLKYATVHSSDTALGKAYSCIIYFNARTAIDVHQGITSFWSTLRPSVSFKLQNQTLVTDFHSYLRAQENWLLIFDNVENLNEISDFLPPTTDAGHIIFATRHESIASQLTLGAEPVRIEPMDNGNATQLAHSLAQSSSRAEDKTIETATRVASFAKGLPLAIEQIVHNAVFLSSRNIADTLRLLETNKARLLQHENFSSLRGPNSSLGAIVMQTMADMKIRDQEAEILFRVLVYWSTSSIPLQLLVDAAGRLPTYLERKFTFDRGQIARTRNKDIDRIDLPSKPPKFRLFDEDPFALDTWRRLCHVKEYRDKYSNVDLPLDDTKFDATIRAACSDSSPIGRAFKNEESILHAVKILTGTGVVQKTSTSTLWIHDLFSELAKAIIELEDKEHKSALTAATLVYLAFPVPSNLALPERRIRYRQYLPHAIKSYHQVKSLGIENNLSLGPELSHIIASVFCICVFDFDTIPNSKQEINPSKTFDSYRKRGNAEAIVYYRSALTGYIASHKRILSTGVVTSQLIVFSTVADEFRERQHEYEDRNPRDRLQRYGRSAFWRMVQTILRLSDLLMEGSYDDLEEAIPMTTIALRMQELLFGNDHDDALRTRQILLCQLTQAGRNAEAYDVAKSGLQKLLGWSEKKQKYCGGKEEYRSFSSSTIAAFFCQVIAKCCLELPGKERESIVYFKVYVRYCQNCFGENLYSTTRPMQDLAMAYERCGEKLASISWFGQSVMCALGVLQLEWLLYETGEEGTRGLPGSEEILEEAVACYEQARQRLGVFTEVSLCKFLGTVDSRIKLWRNNKQMFGPPSHETSVRTQPVFPPGETQEEFDAKIQMDIEEWFKARELTETTIAELEDATIPTDAPSIAVPNIAHT